VEAASNPSAFLTPEEACAAHIGLLSAAALASALAARQQGFASLSPSPVHLSEPLLGASLLIPGHPPAVVESLKSATRGVIVGEGMVLGRDSGRGVVAGVGQGLIVEYSSLPGSVLTLIHAHFGVRLSGAQSELLLEEAARYSKARGEESGGSGGGFARAGLGEGGLYVEDSAVKVSTSWPSLRQAVHKFTSSIHSALEKFNPPIQIEEEEHTSNSSSSSPPPPPLPPPQTTRVQQSSSPDLSPEPIPSHQPLGISLTPLATSNLLPLGEGYPALFPLLEMLHAWNADITLPPPSYGTYTSLRVFNFSDTRQLQVANAFRRAEVPFIIRNIPSLDATVPLWSDDTYLTALMSTAGGGPAVTYPSEVSTGQHFMYFNKHKASKLRGYTPPTQEDELSIQEWLAAAHESLNVTRQEEREVLLAATQTAWEQKYYSEAFSRGGEGEEEVIGRFLASPPISTGGGLVGRGEKEGPSSSSSSSLNSSESPPRQQQNHQPTLKRTPRIRHYLRASTQMANKDVNGWIWDALKYLRSESDSPYGKKGSPDVTLPPAVALEWPFFLADASNQRGIHCRFGMGGIIAEAHSDAGRNFITMQRGHKRYIISPPTECSRLSILKDGPSARHSDIDWSSQEGMSKLGESGALATEVILSPGDALYVPAGWFHFIVSLDTNIQCNTRSGTPPIAVEALSACGIAPPVSEQLGDLTDPSAPQLQPDRGKHARVWGELWPHALKTRDTPLPLAYEDALPPVPLTQHTATTTTTTTTTMDPIEEQLPTPLPLENFLGAFSTPSSPPSNNDPMSPLPGGDPPTLTPPPPLAAPQNNLQLRNDAALPPIPVMLPLLHKPNSQNNKNNQRSQQSTLDKSDAPPSPALSKPLISDHSSLTTTSSSSAILQESVILRNSALKRTTSEAATSSSGGGGSAGVITTPPTPPQSTATYNSFLPYLVYAVLIVGILAGVGLLVVSVVTRGGLWEGTVSASERARMMLMSRKGLRGAAVKAAYSIIPTTAAAWRKRVYKQTEPPPVLAADLVRPKTPTILQDGEYHHITPPSKMFT